MTAAQRRAMNHPRTIVELDFWAQYALDEIRSTYGEYVSINVKAKQLRKFGRTANADSGVKTTVMTLAGTEVNETFVTTNSIDGVSSADDGDTEILTVEGHYYDGSNNLVFHSQDVTLTGQTKATLSQALCRCTRAYVKPGTFASPSSDLAGPVYFYASSGVTVTNGVPQTASAVKLMIAAGLNQSEKCATSLSYLDYDIITGVYASCQRGNSSTVTVDADLEWKQQGGVWRPLGLELSLRTSSQSGFYLPLTPYTIVPPNSDIRMVALSNTNDTTVSGFWNSMLAIKV